MTTVIMRMTCRSKPRHSRAALPIRSIHPHENTWLRHRQKYLHEGMAARRCQPASRRHRRIRHGSDSWMVRVVGLEPTLLSERDFESRASTNFTTPAHLPPDPATAPCSDPAPSDARTRGISPHPHRSDAVSGGWQASATFATGAARRRPVAGCPRDRKRLARDRDGTRRLTHVVAAAQQMMLFRRR